MRHAIERCEERYGGFVLTRDEVAWARDQVRDGTGFAMFLDYQSGDYHLYAVRVRHRWIAMVIDPSTWMVVTVIPEERLVEFRVMLKVRKKQLRAFGLEVAP